MPPPPPPAAPAVPAGAVPLARLLDHAADALQSVREGRSLDDALARVPADARPGVQALAFHALRWLGAAEQARRQLVPKTPPPAVDALLLLALALLWPAPARPYADHTLVDQAVACMRHRTPAAAGFVNAVLRRFVREREAVAAAAARDPVGAWNHPAWWIERVRQDWPRQWQALLPAANEHPPMTLRVNARRGSGAAYVQRLATLGRGARLHPDARLGGQAVLLDQPSPVQALPGFAEGEVSVQDAAAQLAAPLLLGAASLGASAGASSGASNGTPNGASSVASGDAPAGTSSPVAPLRAGARVLDACAAPGGKTAHLLECRPDLDLLALDSDPRRLARVQDNLRRLGLDGARLAAADAREPARWWDGRPFDAILLDAPCTASGIVRRHPDIRWLRRPGDIDALARTQAALLHALWGLLAPGGRLLFATCSIFKAEGQAQIDAFLQRQGTDGVRLDPASPGHWLPLPDNGAPAEPGGGPALHDGFFYALLHKP